MKKTKTKKLFGSNESVFTLGKKIYAAKEINRCEGCVLADFPAKCSRYARPPCDAPSRKDGRNVIFVPMDELLFSATVKALDLRRENLELKRTLDELRKKNPAK